jgi:hypothetical protein
MKSALPIVNELHAEYCARSGFDIPMQYTHERQWGEWLAWRKPVPWGVAELARVIGFIKQGIHNTDKSQPRRFESALRFSNLIARPDLFEEELQLALKAIKQVESATPKGTYKPILPPPPEDRADPAEFAEFAKTFRKPGNP